MRHLGDITKISGYSAPIVDCVIGGSPCQDLSVAGKRAGLDGERSGLYIEQVRIVKEMRERDEHNGRTGVDVRPRYMVWENVPGAFSSNKGDDFRIVLEEIAKVCDKDAVIPMPDKGKWTNHGCILGDGWSAAWRVLDAQFWGVPQRRRRIALVADFGGHSAPEILFVRESVSGNTDEGKQKRKATPSDAERSLGADNRLGVAYGISSYNSNAMKSSNPHSGIYEADTSRTLDLNGGNPSCNQGGIAIVESVPYTLKIRSGCEGGGKGALVQEDKSATLATNNDQYLFQPVPWVKGTRPHTKDEAQVWENKGVANCLNTNDMSESRVNEIIVMAAQPITALDRASFNQGKNAQYDFEISDKGINSSLVANGPSAVCYSIDQGGGKSACNVTEGQSPTLTCTHGGEPVVCYEQPKVHYIVRRLTPLECERLQGYPDGWTDIGEWTDSTGKKRQTSDAARYKALGNSIALPPWKWVLKRLCACYERDATMASLFDGIGGFPYLWEQLNGKGTCLWASEIEEFPMAVTKVRIGE